MVVIVIIAAIMAYFNTVYANKIFPNITINGKDYSGLTKKQAFEKLENEIGNVYKNGFTFIYEDKIHRTGISETGADIDISKTVNNTFVYGHQKNILRNLREQSELIYLKKDFSVKIKLDEIILENYLADEISEIETLPKNFGYFYDSENEKFIPTQPKSGMLINRKKIADDISKNLSGLKNEAMELELTKKYPEIKEDLNKSALIEAQNLLNKKIILKYNSTEWEIQKEDFALWIDFGVKNNSADKNVMYGNRTLSVIADKEKIETYLNSLVPQINMEPINAQLTFNKWGKVDIFFLSQEGIALQVEKSADEIYGNIFAEENYEDDSEIDITVQLAIKKVQPEITTESIDNMGITTLLATGESNFYGSPKNRKHNITVGANKFQGLLVGPEDEFSFNTSLGKVGAKQGYLPELVIKKDKTVPEYGGGLCQVSTTAFRGAVKAGFEITERESHAYPVQYYNPQGTDATIYPPRPDLKFKNNTPAYILIQTRIEGNKLYFDFYGSNDGRKIVLKGPYIYNRKLDGSMKASWTQEVYDKDGELEFKKIFYSNYRSPSLYPH